VHRSEITIDLGALRRNVRTILRTLDGARLWAVVKADGYGHGARRVAHAALDGGATRLAVATLPEADELRGLVAPDHVLVMGGLTAAQAAAAAASGCAISVSSLELAKALAETAQTVPVHLKIDTGMGRFGASPGEARELARFIQRSDGLLLAGTWTHFACADSDAAMTRLQFERFNEALSRFQQFYSPANK